MHQALQLGFLGFFFLSKAMKRKKKKIDHTNVQTSDIKPTPEKCFTVKRSIRTKIVTTAFAGTWKHGGLNDLNKYESTGYLKARQGYVYRCVSR